MLSDQACHLLRNAVSGKNWKKLYSLHAYKAERAPLGSYCKWLGEGRLVGTQAHPGPSIDKPLEI